MSKKRVEWVDISKGIGILLVIIGHCVYLGHFAHNWIFSFHMQLFFILSGLFLSQDSVVNCFKKKCKQLIIPYIVFCIIGLAVSLIIPQWRGFSLKDIARDIYWGYPNAFNVSSVWFLVCLFVTVFIFNIILIIQKKKSVLGWMLFTAIVCFGFLFGRFPGVLASFPAGRMPLDSDCACVALLFLALGYFFRNKIFLLGKDLSEKSIGIPFICAIVSLAVTVLIVLLNGTVNLHGITYHNEILYICGSLSGFFFVFFLSLIVEKTDFVKGVLVWFGRNSLKIMGVQAIVVRLYLFIVNSITGDAYQLYFLPPLYAVIGCFAVTIVSAVIVIFYNGVKKQVVASKSQSHITA